MSDIHFGTDGWRARIAEDFTFDNVRRAAQGFADYLKAIYPAESSRGVVVGGDKRFRSEDFAAAAAEVLAANGIPVHFCGGGMPTPIISFGVTERHALGAANITASHNPPNDNGFKVRDENGGAIDPEGLSAIEAKIPDTIAGVRRMEFDAAIKADMIRLYDPVPAYDARIRSLVDVERHQAGRLHDPRRQHVGQRRGLPVALHRRRQDPGGRVPRRPQPDLPGNEATRTDPAERRCRAGEGTGDRRRRRLHPGWGCRSLRLRR